MDEEQLNTLHLMQRLVGKWQGRGTAQYPTIGSFEYREEMEFAANDVQPLLRYEQRTWRRTEGGEFVPSHWEVGFWRVLSANEIEILCAQSGGRVEVARGSLTVAGGGFTVRLNSTLIANDARMDKTAREYALTERTFSYALQMSTSTVPDLTMHVHAELTRT